MPVARVSSKGRITLPVSCRRALGINPKDRVLVETDGDRIIVRPIPDLLELEGFLGNGLPGDVEEARTREGVARHVKERP